MVAPKGQLPLPFKQPQAQFQSQAQPQRISVSLKTPEDLPVTQSLAKSLQNVLGVLKSSDRFGQGWVIRLSTGIVTAGGEEHWTIEVLKNGEITDEQWEGLKARGTR